MGFIQTKASRYNIPVELLHGRRLVYNSLSRAMCLLSAEEAEDFDQLAGGLSSPQDTSDFHGQLITQGLLVGEDVDELAIVRDLYRQHRFDSKVVTLTICPTLTCNFGCDYCFQGLVKSKESLAEDTKAGIVNLFDRMMDEHGSVETAHIAWYGGEPLAKKADLFDLADRLTARCQERGVNYIASMVTNGYFMDREVAARLYDTGLRHVQITLDGSKEYHDVRRHLLSKRGTYDKILANIEEWIDEVPINVNIRVNIDERNAADIKGLIDDLHDKGFAHKPNFTLYFAPVESVTKACHSISDKMMTKLNYGRLEAELYRYAFNFGLAQIPYPPHFIGVCSALRPLDYIVVPCGSVHKCWDTVSFQDKKVGSIFDLDDLFGKITPIQQKWEEFDPFSHPTCSNCKIVPNCASFCAHKFIHADDAIGEASLPCPSLKYSIKEKLVMRAQSQGVITAEDFDPDLVRTDPKELCAEVFDPADYRHYQVSAAPVPRLVDPLPAE